MKRFLLSSILLVTILIIVNAQNTIDSVYLLRMPDKQSAYVKIPNTGAFFVKNAGLGSNHSGWQLPEEFVKSDSNMLYFEMNSTDVPDGPWNEYSSGSLELVLNIPNGIKALNLDTVSRLRYHLINNYAERGAIKIADNRFSGLLNFEYPNDSTVAINGVISLKTNRPYFTNQQVVYSGARFAVLSQAQFLYTENRKKN